MARILDGVNPLNFLSPSIRFAAKRDTRYFISNPPRNLSSTAVVVPFAAVGGASLLAPLR
jgi:hypothetical protein